MTHLDLFSGIGGFALAAEAVGFKTIGFSEIDPFCCKVLKKHWPDIPNYGDIRTVPTVKCDLITGGFPCQPFSSSGRRGGAKDERHLWPTMFNVIKRCEPRYILGENVIGFIDMELDNCIADLESIGYQAQPLVIPACALGASIISERVWILAAAIGQRLPKSRFEMRKGSVEFVPHLAQSWPPGPSAIADIPRRVDGVSNRVDRLRAIGNAIVPQVAEVILGAIASLA